jgi:enolase-phosphatase E1
MPYRSGSRLPDPAIRAVLVDIEGTTTPIAFVHDVLFPFARARLPDLLRAHANDPVIAAEIAAVQQAAPGQDPASVLFGWMDGDVKQTSLKTLQGLIWRQGYLDGTLQGVLYPDVAPCLQRWHRAGHLLFVYSSGSVEAQRLLFGHSDAGDLAGLFGGFFDTRVGPKRAADSYRAIAAQTEMPAPTILFLSDVEAELDAAGEAGLSTCQLVRAEDRTIASARHPTAERFTDVEIRFGL